MSSSSAPVDGTLIIEGEPGVEIRVLDEDFSLRARGTVRLETNLPAKLYMINWKGLDGLRQEVVRLRPGQVRTVKPKPSVSPAPTSVAAEILSAVEDPNHSAARTSRRADIVVIVDGRNENARSTEFRLFSRDVAGNPLRSDGRAVKDYRVDQLGGTTACFYNVRPDTYRLQFKGVQGETLDQIVPAFAGRRTIVVVRSGVGEVLVKAGEKLGTVTYQGIDPTETKTFTTSREQPGEECAETARLAGVLLSALAAQRTCLGDTLLAVIEAGAADPLLKIYAAAIIVSRLEADLAPSLEEPFPNTIAKRRAFTKKWLARASDLIEPVRGKGVPADIPVLAWRIKELLGQRQQPMPKIATPPMLECAWKWAMMQSVSNPGQFPKSFSFRNAERGAIGSSPWLVWRAAAAKGGDLGDERPTASTLRSAFQTLAEGAATLVRQAQVSIDDRDPLHNLSTESRKVASATLSLLLNESRPAVVDVAKQFAAATQLPGSTIIALARQAIEEISGSKPVPQTEESNTVGSGLARIAPALGRPVFVPDDPQKGRFGGKSEVNGFRLYVRFEETKRDWVNLTLVVAAPEEMDGEVAEFFLHDTFKPINYPEAFKGKRSELTEVRAWGGFTCGVWIPSRNIELELDLSAVPRAPRIIRDL